VVWNVAKNKFKLVDVFTWVPFRVPHPHRPENETTTGSDPFEFSIPMWRQNNPSSLSFAFSSSLRLLALNRRPSCCVRALLQMIDEFTGNGNS
jgi:hypothetical protein